MSKRRTININEMPGHLIRRFHQIAVAVVVGDLSAAGIDLTPVQFAALSLTERHPGIDQATLAGLIAYDRNTIGGVVDRLVKKGYLKREVSSRDRRARELILTPLGTSLLRRAEPVVEKAQKTMLAGLNKRESLELVRLLAKATTAANTLSRAPLQQMTTDD